MVALAEDSNVIKVEVRKVGWRMIVLAAGLIVAGQIAASAGAAKGGKAPAVICIDGRPDWAKYGPKNPTPPVKLRNAAQTPWNYGKNKVGFVAPARIWDPVHKELLWVGGWCGSMEDGFAGNWRTSDGKTWKRAEWKSAVLDPLRVKCLEARNVVRDGENAGRNIHFSDLGAKEAEAMKGRPAKLLGEAVKLAGEAVAAIQAALPKAKGWEKQSVERSLALASKALGSLKAAHAGFSAGRIDAGLLAKCFDGQWKLDEAAGALAGAPGAICQSCNAYDPERRCVVLFGGTHGDYVVNDTWIYDCAKRAWQRVWSKTAPAPRCKAGRVNKRKDKKVKYARLTWDLKSKRLALSGGVTVIDYVCYAAGYMSLKKGSEGWSFDAGSGEWAGPGKGYAPGSRTYHSDVCKLRDPRWFDSEEKGSRAETEKWHTSLKPNVWTRVPVPKGGRLGSMQCWGHSPLDRERDLIFAWSGGHEADGTDVLPTYHIAVNRWSIGYVPAQLGKGIGFDGRPDCANHTMGHLAWDPVSKKVVMTHMAGTSVYNPDRGDYDCNFDHNFQTHIYETRMEGTPKGVYVWTPGALRLFDEKNRKWRRVKVTGKLSSPMTCKGALQYDSKRNALWMMRGKGWTKKGVNLWKLELGTMVVEPVKAGGQEVPSKIDKFRESAYLPEADLIVMHNFVDHKQVAFDPEERKWLRLNIPQPKPYNGYSRPWRGVEDNGLVYDANRGLLFFLSMYQKMYVLKLDFKTLRKP